jgi:hypothetical protein
MNTFYIDAIKALGFSSGLEKTASLSDLKLASDARSAQVLIADNFVEKLKLAASKLPGSTLYEKVASLVLGLRDTHQLLGEKNATAPDVQADALMKLSAAILLDDVLTDQLNKVAESEFVETKLARSLGREYVLHLVGALLS